MEPQKNKKISEMVNDFAGDFISLGEDIQEMQQYLHAAVSVDCRCLIPRICQVILPIGDIGRA